MVMISSWNCIIRRCTVSAIIALTLVSVAAAADRPTGEQLYRKQCASCHGQAGEGVKGKYEQALIGNRTPAQLAKLIAKTMPENAPGTCKGVDADKVAEFIFEAFYSPAAQARNKPPRVELSRLTVSQYRNSVADVLDSFRGRFGKWDDKHGLAAEQDLAMVDHHAEGRFAILLEAVQIAERLGHVGKGAVPRQPVGEQAVPEGNEGLDAVGKDRQHGDRDRRTAKIGRAHV